MNKSKKLNRKQIISNLYKEFKILENGKDIEVAVNLNTIKVPVNISWESDMEAEYASDLDVDIMNNVWIKAEKTIEQVCKKELKSFNQKIKTFVNKCDGIATQLGEDKQQFFESMMDYGINKFNRTIQKRALNKAIKDTEKKLSSLKKEKEIL